jgi:hypothetical protein
MRRPFCPSGIGFFADEARKSKDKIGVSESLERASVSEWEMGERN